LKGIGRRGRSPMRGNASRRPIPFNQESILEASPSPSR